MHAVVSWCGVSRGYISVLSRRVCAVCATRCRDRGGADPRICGAERKKVFQNDNYRARISRHVCHPSKSPPIMTTSCHTSCGARPARRRTSVTRPVGPRALAAGRRVRYARRPARHYRARSASPRTLAPPASPADRDTPGHAHGTGRRRPDLYPRCPHGSRGSTDAHTTLRRQARAWTDIPGTRPTHKRLTAVVQVRLQLEGYIDSVLL